MNSNLHWANTREVGAAWGIRALVLIYRVLGRTVLFIAHLPGGHVLLSDQPRRPERRLAIT